MATELPEDYAPPAPEKPAAKPPAPAKKPRKPRVATVKEGVPRPRSTPTVVQSEESVERDRKAMALAVDGWSNAAIARELQYRDGSAVREAITRHTARIIDQPARAVREVMLAQLDSAIAAAISTMHTPVYKLHQGDLVWVEDPVTKEQVPMQETGSRLAAANTLSTLLKRKSELLGIDPPERQEISITQLPAHVNAWLDSKKAQALGG